LATITNTNIKNLSDVIEYNLLYTGVMGGVPGTVQGFLTGQDGFDQAIVNAYVDRSGISRKHSQHKNSVGGYNSTFLDANVRGPFVLSQYWLYWQARLYELAQKAVDGAHYYTTADGETKRVDALLTPSAGLATTPGSWLVYVRCLLDHGLGAVAGWPMITVPAGISSYNNVPYGIVRRSALKRQRWVSSQSLIGVAWTEPKLIAVGSAIDDLIKKRELPKFYEYWSKNTPIADTMT
jgi:amidase